MRMTIGSGIGKRNMFNRSWNHWKLLDCCLQSFQLWNGDGQTKEQSSNYIIHNIIIGLLKILTSQPKGWIKFKRLLNLCLWTVKSVETWAWHASLHLCFEDSYLIPIGREQRLGQLCHITRYARRAQHSLIRSCLREGGRWFYHFIAGGFDQKVMMFLTEKVIYEWESKCVESVFN